jgi:hypothetical protein
MVISLIFYETCIFLGLRTKLSTSFAR